MKIEVETEKDARGIDIPRRIRMDGRSIDVERVVDQWHGKDHRYLKLQGLDGDLYVLRFDENSSSWALTLFESARARSVSRRL